ncbi:ATP10 protein [Colletotrichum scovillei]|uniref:ATP10 protein n=1 Tax=Colletotrichum scovillei TaxID=1209932 RepID=A0A9P7R7H9_9PEZI|nr:ATP10 protein [Colletotrichum scovillei]KAF4782222.1 ATP10 protein [Colletotrichum scovillei]KAG7050334.1 ATP10 protein [Colletotrichum scovillei]KAG7069374.1 ATP10 protein [Colletotrichum scovillei]KAG7073363.1 ATP10 protein [Colletotrichum scovillei]
MVPTTPLRTMALSMGASRRTMVSCAVCAWRRHLSTSRPYLADKLPNPAPGAAPVEAPKPDLPGSAIHAPRAYGKKINNFTPQPLPRPIGMAHPPHPEDNSGVDRRSLKERRDDFVDYDKHLVRRKELKEKMARPYFRDWRNMQFHEGKSFIAPPLPFKADMSLFFPNFVGDTLAKNANNPRDTTRTLLGKVSVVAVYSSQWADDQAKTFISPEANPELHELLAKTPGKTQVLQLNIEDNKFKAWIVKMFMGNLRKLIPEHNWGKYFLVPRGITNEISESIGYLNSKVGYVYLVDNLCRIRWAASGPSHPDERESLVKGMKLVLHEWNKNEKAALEAAQVKDAAKGKKEVS